MHSLAQTYGIHRINVVDEKTGRVRAVLSQTDIARYLLSRRQELESIFTRTLEDLNLGIGPVVSISGITGLLLFLVNSTVLEALARMSEYSVSSIAVVDGADCLIGNISMADVRFIFKNSRFNRLWMTCQDFIAMVLSQKGLENRGRVKEE